VGRLPGGDAPGVKFENCYWCHEKEIAAICTDTWGVEVRPNETMEANQPWHRVVIPAMGLCMGEIFYLEKLAEELRRRPRLRVPLLRPAARHHWRDGIADQPAGDQVRSRGIRCFEAQPASGWGDRAPSNESSWWALRQAKPRTTTPFSRALARSHAAGSTRTA
jgi:hypothetical protein